MHDETLLCVSFILELIDIVNYMHQMGADVGLNTCRFSFRILHADRGEIYAMTDNSISSVLKTTPVSPVINGQTFLMIDISTSSSSTRVGSLTAVQQQQHQILTANFEEDVKEIAISPTTPTTLFTYISELVYYFFKYHSFKLSRTQGNHFYTANK